MQSEELFEITPELEELSNICVENGKIERELYTKYDVKRGLRDINGKGVLAGLTEISEICSKKTVDGVEQPCDGKLYYRGVDVEDIVKGFINDDRFGFEEVVYLLIFGKLPNKKQFEQIKRLLAFYRNLPQSFTRDIILKAPSAFSLLHCFRFCRFTGIKRISIIMRIRALLYITLNQSFPLRKIFFIC